jgi:hypothetical protein
MAGGTVELDLDLTVLVPDLQPEAGPFQDVETHLIVLTTLLAMLSDVARLHVPLVLRNRCLRVQLEITPLSDVGPGPY